MRAVGLITEYNPFHNGHLHHLRESRRHADAEVAVAVMSGHFLQRGEPALVDKWLRTELALAAGVDVVLELPFPWACNSAPHFAAGAIQLLTACGGIDSFCFGSEAGDLTGLQRQAAFLQTHGAEIERRTTALLRSGVAYPAARASAVTALGGDAAGLERPNNILGIAYLRALLRTGSPLQALTIPRLGAGYHDPVPCGEIASATALRTLVAGGEAIAPYVPPPVWELLAPVLAEQNTPCSERLHTLLLGRLLGAESGLAGIYQLDSGMAERLAAAALTSSNYRQLCQAGKARHLTLTRVQRLLSYILLQVGHEEMTACLASGPGYLRLLGHSARGARFLAATRKQRQLPVLGNLSRANAQLGKYYYGQPELLQSAHRQLTLDLRATRIYNLLLRRWRGSHRNGDYFAEVLRR